MRPVPPLYTPRLLLRMPTLADLDAVHSIHGDPETNRFNPNGAASRDACRDKVQGWIEHWRQQGFGYWALCRRERPEEILGFGGIMDSRFGERTGLNLYFRLAVPAWGQGYANEMATAALELAFHRLQRPAVIGLVRPDNLPSRRALERLGLSLYGELEDFPELAPSLLYRLDAEDYLAQHPRPGGA